jgi:putative SOS response-associated peptidase YedK
MPVEEAPDDDSNVRQSYNFAPGYHGLVYRADGPETGGQEEGATEDTKYKLQSMQWGKSPNSLSCTSVDHITGLVPFWTKRNPDYGSKMKTINCRDDSLFEDRGMWTTMKKKKRCIIVAQGFYEWLKKNGGKEKLPHFTKRKDGQLMCFAGLWDCVQFEDSNEKLFTYTIITTDSNKQLKFLHDRMPVVFDNGSDAIRTWLDPTRTEWNTELQSLLKPYEGELECYPVSKDVGKVGNNSPSFLVPINSAANKNNIANFFGNQRKAAETKAEKQSLSKAQHDLEKLTDEESQIEVEHDADETRATTDPVEGTEDNAPLPIPATSASQDDEPKGIKREHDGDAIDDTADEPQHKRSKPLASASPIKSPAKQTSTPAKKQGTRSATSNGSAAKASKADGSRKITSFFSNK